VGRLVDCWTGDGRKLNPYKKNRSLGCEVRRALVGPLAGRWRDDAVKGALCEAIHARCALAYRGANAPVMILLRHCMVGQLNMESERYFNNRVDEEERLEVSA
jgi:hypothetical protein